MSLEGALYTRLQAVTGVTDLVSTRIWPNKTDTAEPAFPYVTYEIVDEQRASAFGADTGDVDAIVRFHCWGKDDTAGSGFDEARDVADELRQALQRWTGTLDSTQVTGVFVDGRNSLQDPEPGVFHVVIDFRVTYKE